MSPQQCLWVPSHGCIGGAVGGFGGPAVGWVWWPRGRHLLPHLEITWCHPEAPVVTLMVSPAASHDPLSPPWWPPVGTSMGFGGRVISCPTLRSPGAIPRPLLSPSWCPQWCQVTFCHLCSVPSVTSSGQLGGVWWPRCPLGVAAPLASPLPVVAPAVSHDPWSPPASPVLSPVPTPQGPSVVTRITLGGGGGGSQAPSATPWVSPNCPCPLVLALGLVLSPLCPAVTRLNFVTPPLSPNLFLCLCHAPGPDPVTAPACHGVPKLNPVTS